MDDEDLYLEASNELEAGNKQEALWIKALALVGGDEEKAKHQYILLRVEQLKRRGKSTESNGHTHYSGQAIYKSIYFASFIIGILLASYVYLINFDNFSETVLIRITPLWFFPIVFGYYGFVSLRMAGQLEKSNLENVADLLLSVIKESAGTVGKLASLFVHAPFIIIKSKKPILVALGGSIIWAILLVIFFEAIFPTL
jgi:hypothetical protein